MRFNTNFLRFLAIVLTNLVLVEILSVDALGQRVTAFPKTTPDDFVENFHGTKVADPYHWLGDLNTPSTQAWINQQNFYAKSVLDLVPGRNLIRSRLESLFKLNNRTNLPTVRGSRYFFTKDLFDQGRRVICLKAGLDSAEEVLIDSKQVNSGQNNGVFLLGVSPDGKLLAYGTNKVGEQGLSVSIFDVEQRKDKSDKFPTGFYILGTSFMPQSEGLFDFDASFSFKLDNSGFFYSRYTQSGPAIYYHAMNTDANKDIEFFSKGISGGIPDEIIARLSDEGRYLSIFARYFDHIEVYVKNLQKDEPTQIVVNDLEEYFLGQIVGDSMYLWTTWGAPKGRIVLVNLKSPARELWSTIIPESDMTITGFVVMKNGMVVNYLKNVSSVVKLFETSGEYVRDFPLPSGGSAGGLRGTLKSDEVFYMFTSFTQPLTIYRYELYTKTQSIWGDIKLVSNSDQLDYKQVWFESREKTKVPMYILYKKGTNFNGDQPTLLTGLGGFRFCNTPIYLPNVIYWIEQGGVYAIVNMRGGTEFGELWYKNGILDKKHNSSDDFIAAAEYLTSNGYTNPSKLAAHGNRNSAVVLSAAINQRPELFKAVSYEQPLFDLVNLHNHFISKPWTSEYGDVSSKKEFQYVYQYSPYHNVKPGANYPATLMIAIEDGSNLYTSHSRKMTARLQNSTASNRPVLLYDPSKSGNPNLTPIDLVAIHISFLFAQLGVTPS